MHVFEVKRASKKK